MGGSKQKKLYAKIAQKLRKKSTHIPWVSADTGISDMTLRRLMRREPKRPSEKFLKILAEYFEIDEGEL